MRHFVFLIAIFVSLIPDLRAKEPLFKPNDVVALVGGEDMVVAAELGYLETFAQLALPDHHLKFRSLAREGDTVFEQRRDLNYPKLEDQLDKIGATVVICQFGQMESLAGEEKVGEFVAAYEKLIGRLSGGGKRRVILYGLPVGTEDLTAEKMKQRVPNRMELAITFTGYISDIASRTGCRFVGDNLPFNSETKLPVEASDGIHRSLSSHTRDAALIVFAIDQSEGGLFTGRIANLARDKPLTALITAKNRLWYYYYRPQNWAFLAGDRTNQPSSRDHLDPSKRWFPEELEKFVPLIDAKDAEIWALAKKLSAQGGK